ncbi:MAG TPA: hypothetical protein VGG85_17055 [Terracidiphilus sp.]
MKRWIYMTVAGALVGGAVYLYIEREGPGIGGLLHAASSGGDPGQGSGRPARLHWKMEERPDEGFKVDLPADPKDLQVPAYNEDGGSEQVKMIVANPDADTTFGVTWEDNPPVARVSHTPERTLNMARDGMLARTQTSLVSESRGAQRGNPTLDISARNGGGGVLNARFIFAGDRLYMLIALFPSSSARREQDVTRFFNSFAPLRGPAIPESMPIASQN